MFVIQIEIVGTCNLRCPSCPVGNMDAPRATGSIGGTMKLEQFQRALDWAEQAIPAGARDTMVCLYSWGEPFIHPDLPALVAAAKARGHVVGISSNLNHMPDPEPVLRAGVDEIVVSLSGFTQEVYGIGHAGGDIAKVRSNMQVLADAIGRTGSAVRVMLHYITYRHNLGLGEFAAMAGLAEALHFDFAPSLAFFAPVEKLTAMARGAVAAADQPILGQLLVPIEAQLAIARQSAPASTCTLIEDRIDIDVDGAVKLCCASYDRRFNVAPAFAAEDVATVQARRRQSALCGTCLGLGVERVFTRLDYPAWCAHANAVLAEIAAPVRCVGPHLVCDTQPTESMLLALVNDCLVSGRAHEAPAAFARLHGRLGAKYGKAGQSLQAVLAYVRSGGRQLGRAIPLDPLRVFFAEALIAMMVTHEYAKAGKLLAELDALATALRHAGIYARTAVEMTPIIHKAIGELPPRMTVRRRILPRLLRRAAG